MTKEDIENITAAVVAAMNKREEEVKKREEEEGAKHFCPLGIDGLTVETMKQFAEAIHSGKKAAMKAFVTLAVGALCAAVAAGIKELFNK